jgi:hypothetical protein
LWDDIKQKDWNFESTSSLNESLFLSFLTKKKGEKKRKEEFEKLRKEFQKKPSNTSLEPKPEASFFFGFENSLLETLEEEHEDLSAFEEIKTTFDSKSIFSMMNEEFVDFKEMETQMPSEQDILKNLTQPQEEEMTDVQSIEVELLKSLKNDQSSFMGPNNVEFEQPMMQNNLPMFLMHPMPPPNFFPPNQEMFHGFPQQGFPMNEMGMPYGAPPPFGNDFLQQPFAGYPPPPPEFLMMMMNGGMNPNLQGNVPMNAMTVEEIEQLMMKK